MKLSKLARMGEWVLLEAGSWNDGDSAWFVLRRLAARVRVMAEAFSQEP